MKKLIIILIMLALVVNVVGCKAKKKEPEPEIGPILYYQFDEDDGDEATDASGKGKHGTRVGAAAWSSEGRVGGAISFPGGDTEGYVSLPNNIMDGLQSITIALWVKIEENLPWARVCDFGGSKGIMYLTLNGWDPDLEEMDKIRFSIYGGNPDTEVLLTYSNELLELNEWAHIAITGSSAGYSLFVNGEKKTTIPATELPKGIGTNDLGTNYLAKVNPAFPDPYFCGMMDEFYIYNRALTDKEIQALYVKAEQ